MITPKNYDEKQNKKLQKHYVRNTRAIILEEQALFLYSSLYVGYLYIDCWELLMKLGINPLSLGYSGLFSY